MIVSTNLTALDAAQHWRPPAGSLVCAIDVEWSKNYRVPGGNIPFCYCAVWVTLPTGRHQVSGETAQFWHRSVYVENSGQTSGLVADAATTLAWLAEDTALIAGHQMCSDLGVLAASAGMGHPVIADLQKAWRSRRNPERGRPRVLDTRYDTGEILACRSRRLVDVCDDLQLDVTQPELRGTSMTAQHRRWLETGDRLAWEKISVLNLRHALSTALVALRAAGLGCWRPGLNVIQLLADGLGDAFGWLTHPAFRELLEASSAA